MGLNLSILGIPIKVKNHIEQSIEKYKVQNELKKFQYSKANTIFLKKLCENVLKDFFPEMNSNVIKTLIDNEIRKASKINPYGGIHLKGQEDIILRIPSKIRNYVCCLIYKIISRNKGNSREEILTILNKEILDSDNQDLINALKTLRYIIALSKYFDSLIILLRRIKTLLKNKVKISPTRVILDLDLPFGRKTVERISNNLKNNFPKDFEIVS